MISDKISRLKQRLSSALLIIANIKNWPVYFLDHFKLLEEKDIVYRLRSGQKIKVKVGTSDWRWVFCEVFIFHHYNPEGFEIEKGDLVVDVGAHVGMFSIYASKLALKVYSVEPLAENFEFLKENININKAENIYPFNVAMSGKTGDAEIFINSSSFAHSFYVQDGVQKKIKVPTVSLEDFVVSNNINKIDFLKMDCEGAEYDIFFNCPKEILKKIRKISMECHDINPQWNTEKLRNFLGNNGFTVNVKSTNSKGLSYIFAKNKEYK